MTQENAKIWSVNQVKAQRWLATPTEERKPPTQEDLATEIGVHSVTLSKWKQMPGFMDAVYSIAEEYLGGDLSDIYAALRKEAKAGSYQHIKLALELTGRYVQKIAPTTPDGKDPYGGFNADQAAQAERELWERKISKESKSSG